MYEETKRRYNISLTPTGFQQLDVLATERGLSKSELIERIARGIFSLTTGENGITPADRETMGKLCTS